MVVCPGCGLVFVPEEIEAKSRRKRLEFVFNNVLMNAPIPFSRLYRLLKKRGYKHTYAKLSGDVKFLATQGKVVRTSEHWKFGKRIIVNVGGKVK